MRIEVICTGDEVLTGKIVNSNFSYITQKLEDVGLSVNWETTVGDDRENLLHAFQLAGERADAVIVNGGLGPTVDDLSQEIAAKAAGVDLALNEDWLKRMEDFFQRRSRVMPVHATTGRIGARAMCSQWPTRSTRLRTRRTGPGGRACVAGFHATHCWRCCAIRTEQRANRFATIAASDTRV